MREVKVFLIHGACCNSSHLAPLETILASMGLRPILVTLPGHGVGEDPGGLSLRDYVAHVSEILDQTLEPGETAFLVGHSMGGDVAQMLAAEDERVLGLVLIASLSNSGVMLGFSLLMRMLAPHYLWAMLTGRAVCFREQDLKDLLLSEVVDPDREIRTFVFESGRALLEAALAQPIFWRKPKMKNPEGRVLVIAGERDRTMVLRVERAIARFYGRVPLVIKKAGHMMFQENCSKRVSRHVARWVKTFAQLANQSVSQSAAPAE